MPNVCHERTAQRAGVAPLDGGVMRHLACPLLNALTLVHRCVRSKDEVTAKAESDLPSRTATTGYLEFGTRWTKSLAQCPASAESASRLGDSIRRYSPLDWYKYVSRTQQT